MDCRVKPSGNYAKKQSKKVIFKLKLMDKTIFNFNYHDFVCYLHKDQHRRAQVITLKSHIQSSRIRSQEKKREKFKDEFFLRD